MCEPSLIMTKMMHFHSQRGQVRSSMYAKKVWRKVIDFNRKNLQEIISTFFTSLCKNTLRRMTYLPKYDTPLNVMMCAQKFDISIPLRAKENLLNSSHGQNFMIYVLMRAHWLSDQLFLLRINALDFSVSLFTKQYFMSRVQVEDDFFCPLLLDFYHLLQTARIASASNLCFL